MNKFLAALVVIFMVSCKSKAIVAGTTTPVTYMKAKSIIASHYDNKSNFSTLYIKANVKYSDDRQSQNVTAEIKIKKDEQILVSIRFLGITMAKALITPTSVSYYEKINGTYFEGDFSALSQWLGTDLDFYKIQNMLLGKALDDLKKGKYTESLVEQLYRLDDMANDDTKKTFYINASDFSINRQEITQTAEERMIQVAYTYIKEYKETILPATVVIHTYQKEGKSEINLEYDTITFDEELSFPYNVPNSYNRSIIK
jgi:hypothetical protein